MMNPALGAQTVACGSTGPGAYSIAPIETGLIFPTINATLTTNVSAVMAGYPKITITQVYYEKGNEVTPFPF
jgi:hypothetical protein